MACTTRLWLRVSIDATQAQSYDGSKERQLLDTYHTELVKSLVRFGAAKTEEDARARVMPRDVLQAQYESGVLVRIRTD